MTERELWIFLARLIKRLEGYGDTPPSGAVIAGEIREAVRDAINCEDGAAAIIEGFKTP